VGEKQLVQASPTKIIIDDPQGTGWGTLQDRPPHGHLFRCDPSVGRTNQANTIEEGGLPTFYCRSHAEIITTTRELLARWAARNGNPAYCRVRVSLHRI
jgi:hypothetical protein